MAAARQSSWSGSRSSPSRVPGWVIAASEGSPRINSLGSEPSAVVPVAVKRRSQAPQRAAPRRGDGALGALPPPAVSGEEGPEALEDADFDGKGREEGPEEGEGLAGGVVEGCEEGEGEAGAKEGGRALGAEADEGEVGAGDIVTGEGREACSDPEDEDEGEEGAGAFAGPDEEGDGEGEDGVLGGRGSFVEYLREEGEAPKERDEGDEAEAEAPRRAFPRREGPEGEEGEEPGEAEAEEAEVEEGPCGPNCSADESKDDPEGCEGEQVSDGSLGDDVSGWGVSNKPSESNE